MLKPLATLLLTVSLAPACDLCAVYNASTTRGESSSGFFFTMSEQFVPFRTVQLDGEEVHPSNADKLDSFTTHLVPTYNFSSRFGVSLNIPLVHRSFRRTDLIYSTGGPPTLQTERGHESGLGDISAIARWVAWEKNEMDYGIVLTLLGGVKLPTGNTDRLRDELDQTRIYEDLLPPNTPHDPLSHSIASVHQHQLSAGSGSYDGIAGLTLNTRWQRWFFNSQFQYYARTKGDYEFRFGDQLMISGGPGAYVWLDKVNTLNVQALAVYDTMARDEIIGRKSNRTGMTAWYVGPQISFTIGEHFSGNAGIDIPVHIANNGYQNVPDYRIHGGVNWRF
jgi:hypothetical protein